MEMQKSKYDTQLEPSDWRFAASIVGLVKYFKFHRLEDEFEICEECLLYNREEISEEKYLEFAEYVYGDEFHHKAVEHALFAEDFTEEEIKRINERMSGNTVIKRVFGKLKFDGSNKEEILQIIEENRIELIRETFRNKNNMYKNYCNTNMLFQKGGEYCRLWGFCIDGPKKGKSVSYGFDTSSFVMQDVQEFDFIPFGFQGGRETFFVNDNVSIERLIGTNLVLENAVRIEMEGNDSRFPDVRKAFFKNMIESANFVDYDLEVIVKKRDVKFFESLFIRKKSIHIFQSLKDHKNIYNAFCFPYKKNDDSYINVQEEVTNSILNLVLLDGWIELFLKSERNNAYLIDQLITVNIKIRGVRIMKEVMWEVKQCAGKVAAQLPENKVTTYQNKLTSAIVFKDYDKFCQILLQLSNYSKVNFDFAYDLFEDFEKNKDLAYTFVNGLHKNQGNDSNRNGKNIETA